ncbi:aggregation factor core [Roseibium denhamense]|uniref:Aggregation factor core n=1 Tax=Roseibium denhamense TaxID=76305 RepID=A0ABY1P5I3_9HYPH|nr:aggregation factor core [Roseibium denhamense]MTI07258.1 aggregation factor core [Roseibium denhamense]SMP26226.1 hypothetical protein SAMN06265374_2692 [Roseibium denhamense]
MRMIATLGIALTVSVPALADLSVRFDEGAPKDRFTISASGGCDISGPMTVTIDLKPSPYGLIFDTTSSGAGVQVFQPFEITDGRGNLSALPEVKDGDNRIDLDVKGLRTFEKISFTIDVDDTVQNREITVSNGEITGAKVVALRDGMRSEAAFGPDAVATLKMTDCVS